MSRSAGQAEEGKVEVVVVGAGKVGTHLAVELERLGHQVTVVGRTAEAFRRLPEGFRGRRVVGFPADRAVLEEAGVEKADAVAAVTEDDNLNVMVARLALAMGVPRALARVYDPEVAAFYGEEGLLPLCPTLLVVGEALRVLQAGDGKTGG